MGIRPCNFLCLYVLNGYQTLYIIIIISLDPTSGLLKLKNMVHLFQKKGYTEHHASLVFQFLHQFGVILPIDKETALVPSLVLPTPMVSIQ